MLRQMIIGVAVVATALAGCASPVARPGAAELKAMDASIAAAMASAIPVESAVPEPKAEGGHPVFISSGKARVTVDGTVVSMPGPVYCFVDKGLTRFLINVGPKKVSGGHAMVTLDQESLGVQMFDIQTRELVILLNEEDNVGELIKATHSGDDYLVEGEGSGWNAGVVKTMTYAIDVSCPPGWATG